MCQYDRKKIIPQTICGNKRDVSTPPKIIPLTKKGMSFIFDWCGFWFRFFMSCFWCDDSFGLKVTAWSNCHKPHNYLQCVSYYLCLLLIVCNNIFTLGECCRNGIMTIQPVVQVKPVHFAPTLHPPILTVLCQVCFL